MRRRSLFLLAALLTALGAGLVRLQAEAHRGRTVSFVNRNPAFLPNGRLLRWMCLGHGSTVADALWIRAVLYFGRRVADDDNRYLQHAWSKGTLARELGAVDRSRTPIEPRLPIQRELGHLLFRFESRGLMEDLYPLLDRVTTADPGFLHPYVFGGVVVLMETGERDAAEALLMKGRRANPGSWEMPFYLGWLHWMYRGNEEASRGFLLEAASKPAAPPFVGALLAGVTLRSGQAEVTRAYLEGLKESNPDPRFRERIDAILAKLRGSGDVH